MKNTKFDEYLASKNIRFNADMSSLTPTLDTTGDIIIREVLGADNLVDSVTFVDTLGQYLKREMPYVSQVWQRINGTCSSFSNNGTMSHAPVTLDGKYLRYEQALCLEDMRRYFYGAYAGKDINDNSIPFETDFIANSLKYIAQDVSKVFWQGDGFGTSMIAKAVTAGATQLATQSFAVSTAYNNGIIATFDAMAAAIDPALYGETDVTLWVGTAEFLNYLTSLRNVNNFNINPKEAKITGTYLYNHPNIWIMPQLGLTGRGKALLTKKSYVFYGSDVNPNGKTLDSYYDFLSDKTLYRYKQVYASAIAPAGDQIVVASSTNVFS